VIALINGYRSGNGLSELAQNSILMSTAQGQADWLISQPMGSVGDVHAGPGGTRPKDRAYNAGYGGGQAIFISEIVKGGVDETPQSALAWWKTSAPHNNTMLSTTYTEIGAGAATDGNGRWWYVAVTGQQAGGTYAPSNTAPNAEQPAAPVMIPVTKADPQPDGSVVHIIRTGQTLWTIAAVYEVPLDQLLQLNGNNETIYPGDEITVMPPGSMPTLVPTEDPNATPTPLPPTATSQPSPTPAPTQAELAMADTNSDSPSAANLDPARAAEAENATVRLVVTIALVSILAVIVASFFIQRPKQLDLQEEDPFAPID
jgi:LysM repeat protein